MKIRCIATKPSDEQGKKLGISKNYFPSRQDFGLIVGQEYLVYGMGFFDGETWVDIALPGANILHSTPLFLFDIVDRRVSRYWVVGSGAKGGLMIRPPSILDHPYYFDDLSESVPAVVEDFRRLSELLRIEAEVENRTNDDPTE